MRLPFPAAIICRMHTRAHRTHSYSSVLLRISGPHHTTSQLVTACRMLTDSAAWRHTARKQISTRPQRLWASFRESRAICHHLKSAGLISHRSRAMSIHGALAVLLIQYRWRAARHTRHARRGAPAFHPRCDVCELPAIVTTYCEIWCAMAPHFQSNWP